jgi:hypothetical protein
MISTTGRKKSRISIPIGLVMCPGGITKIIFMLIGEGKINQQDMDSEVDFDK